MGGETWKEVLLDKMDGDWSLEIDQFESQMSLRKQAKLDEKVFAETRLRRARPLPLPRSWVRSTVSEATSLWMKVASLLEKWAATPSRRRNKRFGRDARLGCSWRTVGTSSSMSFFLRQP